MPSIKARLAKAEAAAGLNGRMLHVVEVPPHIMRDDQRSGILAREALAKAGVVLNEESDKILLIYNWRDDEARYLNSNPIP